MKRLAKRKTSPPPPGPRHEEVQRYSLLLLISFSVGTLYALARLLGLAGIMFGILVLLSPLIFGPGTVEYDGLWVFVLALALIGPLHYLRRHVERLFFEAKHQLEQIGLPDSARADQSEKTNPRSVGD